MPIYEYRCESCGKGLEKIQKFSDPPLTDCPACGKPALKKLVSASSFRLKGSGWYVTDFKDKKKPAAEGKADKQDAEPGKDKGGKEQSESGSAADKGKSGADKSAGE